jgi:hypothetical protein
MMGYLVVKYETAKGFVGYVNLGGCAVWPFEAEDKRCSGVGVERADGSGCDVGGTAYVDCLSRLDCVRRMRHKKEERK